MAHLTSQISFPYFTNLGQDVITNTHHWQTTAISLSAAADRIALKLNTFYSLVFAVSNTSANHVNWNLGIVKVYDLADPMPRSPEIRSVGSLGLVSGPSAVPTEVACVLSIHAAPESGTPAARLRNRIYIGGIGSTAMLAGSVATFPTFSTNLINGMKNAADDMLDDNDGSLDWVQRSTVGLIASRPITGGWVDNSPDTQRRRGVLATSRTLWP